VITALLEAYVVFRGFTLRLLQYLEYIASNGRMTGAQSIRKNMEGSGGGLTEVLS
jgi:hypothetical protein